MTYNYSSVAGQYALTGAISSSATALTLDSVTGLPSVPFKLVLEPGSMNEEIVKVTGLAGFTLTVVRGWDSTIGVAHAALSVVRHMMTAEDLRMSRQHEDAVTAVHGLTGSPVGTTDTQALTNKDLSAATNIFPASLATDAELASHVGATTGVHGVGAGAVVGTTTTQALTNKDLTTGNTFPSSLATLTGVQVITNKDLSSGTNTFPGFAMQTDLFNHAVSNIAHGATGAVVGTTNTQTLTNKTLTSPSITTPAMTGATNDGVAIPKIKVGTFSGTTDTQGRITTTHGFGFTPTAVLVYNNAPDTSFAILWGIDTIGASTFRTRWGNNESGSGPRATDTVNFTAIGIG